MAVWIILAALMLLLYGIDYLTNSKKTQINGLTIFIVLLLSLLSGLRGEMGVDLQNYLRYFNEIPVFTKLLFGGESFVKLLMVEPLYSLCISLFKIFTDNYNLFLFLQTLLLLTIVVKSLKRLKAPVNIGLIFYFFYSYLDHFGQQRMAIVYVLCLLATTYIVRNELKKFLLTILIASLVQYTAIFFLPAYWVRYLLLSKSRHDSFRYNYLRKKVTESHLYHFFATKQSGMNKPSYWTGIRMIKIIVPLAVALFFTLKFDLAQLIYANINTFTFGNPASNIYAVKFTSYYEKMSIDRNILNAWFGIMSNCLVLVFLYVYRKRWLDLMTAPIFINFAAGLILFVLVYSIPKLGDRLYQMYNISGYIFLFSIMASQKKKALNVIPFILLILFYQYASMLVNETGPYKLLGF